MIHWLDGLVQEAGFLGLLGLFLAAALEYVFPPFPGDTVTIFGGVYAVRGGIPVPLVFASVMLGSLAGASLDYAVGLWVGRRIAAAPQEKRYLHRLSREQLILWEERFRRRGVMWLTLNRFLPGVRGPIFFAAGVSQMAFSKVLLWGGLSSLVWNGVLFAVGYAVGGRAERLEALTASYGRIIGIALAGFVVVWAGRMVWRKARGRNKAPDMAPSVSPSPERLHREGEGFGEGLRPRGERADSGVAPSSVAPPPRPPSPSR